MSDFGFARAKGEAAAAGEAGPVKWEAPETLARREFSEASDAYAFGVTLFELATGERPWAGVSNADAAAAVLRGERPSVPPRVNAFLGFGALVSRCWAAEATARPTFAAIHAVCVELVREHARRTRAPPSAAAVGGGLSYDYALALPSRDVENAYAMAAPVLPPARASERVTACLGRVSVVGDVFTTANTTLSPEATRDAAAARWVDGTREWLMRDLVAWRASRHRVFWLHGDAGVGKSAVASRASLLLRSPALHYCQHFNGPSLVAATAVASLAAQLRVAIPGYRPSPGLAASVDGDTPEALFVRVIAAPLSLLAAPPSAYEGAIVLVIDALDEGARGDGRNAILEMLAGAARAPVWLRILVTSRHRPPRALRELVGDSPVRGLACGSADNMADLARVVRALLAPLPPSPGYATHCVHCLFVFRMHFPMRAATRWTTLWPASLSALEACFCT